MVDPVRAPTSDSRELIPVAVSVEASAGASFQLRQPEANLVTGNRDWAHSALVI